MQQNAGVGDTCFKRRVGAGSGFNAFRHRELRYNHIPSSAKNIKGGWKERKRKKRKKEKLKPRRCGKEGRRGFFPYLIDGKKLSPESRCSHCRRRPDPPAPGYCSTHSSAHRSPTPPSSALPRSRNDLTRRSPPRCPSGATRSQRCAPGRRSPAFSPGAALATSAGDAAPGHPPLPVPPRAQVIPYRLRRPPPALPSGVAPSFLLHKVPAPPAGGTIQVRRGEEGRPA